MPEPPPFVARPSRPIDASGDEVAVGGAGERPALLVVAPSGPRPWGDPEAESPSSGAGDRSPAPATFAALPGAVPSTTRSASSAWPVSSAEATDPATEAGPLAPFLLDPTVTDVFLNPDGSVWVDRGGGLAAEPGLRVPAEEASELAIRLVAAGGRHLDEATPAVDVRLGAGRRVHAVLPPVSPGGAAVSIRLARREQLSLDELVAAGTVTGPDAARLRGLVARRSNLLVTGAGGSGKTTLLAALLAEVPADERILVLEDVAELRIRHPHVVALEARQANLEGAGAIPLDRLVREALRMRPDRLVVGECRGAELRELLSALNTGHDGGAGTLHANSLADVPARLEALGALAGLAPDALARQAVSALHAVVHLERRDGVRRVVAIGAVGLDAAGRLAVTVDRPIRSADAPEPRR